MALTRPSSLYGIAVRSRPALRPAQTRPFSASRQSRSEPPQQPASTAQPQSILDSIRQSSQSLQSQGIDPNASASRESLFVKVPGSYKTRLASPLAPGMPQYLSTKLNSQGLKFPVPPIEEIVNFKERGETVIEQAAKFIMRDGKLSVARRYMSYVLNHLRQSPPPKINPEFKFLLETPDPVSLPLDPVKYFTLAVDSVAPLLRIKSVKGAAGGGQSLLLPVQVSARQRRRIALKWILDTANKKQNKLSGKNTFAHRLAEEIVAIIEGRSSVWNRRELVHKEAIMNRANIGSTKLKKRGRMMR